MKNILTTIPKSKYPNWETCERVLQRCIGEEGLGYWLVNCHYLPNHTGVGALCYLIYDGAVRGYMDLVDTDLSENYRDRHAIGKPRNTKCLVLANWHPVNPILHAGFQGWRYTELRP